MAGQPRIYAGTGQAELSLYLIARLLVGVDRIERNFEPMQRLIEKLDRAQITDERAKTDLLFDLYRREARRYSQFGSSSPIACTLSRSTRKFTCIS